MTRHNGHGPVPQRRFNFGISYGESVRRSAVGPVHAAVDRLALTARNRAAAEARAAAWAAEAAGENPEETSPES